MKEPWHLYPMVTVLMLYILVDPPEIIKGFLLILFIVIIYGFYFFRKKRNK